MLIKLVSFCPTCWSSLHLVTDRLLLVKPRLENVLDLLQWDNLHLIDWKTAENARKFLKPFVQYTSLVGGEDYATITIVVPIVMEIRLHLEEMVLF